jgi:hypothetical protein
MEGSVPLTDPGGPNTYGSGGTAAMARASAVAAFPTSVEVSSATDVSDVSGVPAIVCFIAVTGFSAVVGFLAVAADVHYCLIFGCCWDPVVAVALLCLRMKKSDILGSRNTTTGLVFFFAIGISIIGPFS